MNVNEEVRFNRLDFHKFVVSFGPLCYCLTLSHELVLE